MFVLTYFHSQNHFIGCLIILNGTVTKLNKNHIYTFRYMLRNGDVLDHYLHVCPKTKQNKNKNTTKTKINDFNTILTNSVCCVFCALSFYLVSQYPTLNVNAPDGRENANQCKEFQLCSEFKCQMLVEWSLFRVFNKGAQSATGVGVLNCFSCPVLYLFRVSNLAN